MTSRAHAALRAAVWVLAAALLSAAIDLGFSAYHGYSLRTDRVLLLCADLVPRMLIGSLVLAFCRSMCRLPRIGKYIQRAHWVPIFAAAWLPLLLLSFRPTTGSAWSVQAVVFVLMAAISYFEVRRNTPEPGSRARIGLSLVLLIGIGVTVWGQPVRGASELLPHVAKTRTEPGMSNVLLIVLDTVRADHLGLYGYERDTTPWMDDFATESIVFDDVVAPSSFTLPSHATLFTGLDPRAHGAHRTERADQGVNQKMLGLGLSRISVRPLSSEALTIAEILDDEGYETAAICANAGFLSRHFGLSQGFDTYVDVRGSELSWRPSGIQALLRKPWLPDRVQQARESSERMYLLSNEVKELALEWLEPRKDEPFFLFLNFMDAHWPCIPAAAERDAFPESGKRTLVDFAAILSGERGILPDELEAWVDAYDASLRSQDAQIAAIFAQLERWGVLEKTLVIITGDHGESLGENNLVGHGVSLYESELRVPLVLRLPHERVGQRIDRRVQLTGVYPTILDVLGIARPAGLQHESLLTDAHGLPVVAHLKSAREELSSLAVYVGDWKLIKRTNGDLELYELSEDVHEEVNLAAQRPELVESMSAKLDGYLRDVQPRFASEESGVDRDVVERLQGLGYTE